MLPQRKLSDTLENIYNIYIYIYILINSAQISKEFTSTIRNKAKKKTIYRSFKSKCLSKVYNS